MRCVAALVGALVFCSVVTGEPYEFNYYPPGSVYGAGLDVAGPFPEHQGWEWNYGYGTVARSITTEAELQLEALEWGDWDAYVRDLDPADIPEETEYLYAKWRVAITAGHDYDCSVGIALGEEWGDMGLALGCDHVRDLEGFEWYDYSGNPGDPHTLVLRSVNLVEYDLFVDGQYAFSDVFKLPTLLDRFVDWGDTATAFSTSVWGFFRFGATWLGDIDIDGHVDLMDFATFAMCYYPGSTTPPPGCSDLEFALSDLDNDGDVDLSDFGVFALNYGS